jgi:hypothetical protein
MFFIVALKKNLGFFLFTFQYDVGLRIEICNFIQFSFFEVIPVSRLG